MNEDLTMLSGAYALNALPEEERIKFEKAVKANEALLYEVTELQDTAVILSRTAPSAMPSPNLKFALMRQIAITPQLPAETFVKNNVISISERRTAKQPKAWASWFQKPAGMLVAVAASVGLIFAGSISGGMIGSSMNQTNQAVETSHIGYAELSAADDAKTLASAVTTGGNASLVWSDDLSTAAVVNKNMAVLPDGESYQLWYVPADGSNPRFAGTLDDSANSWQVLNGDRKAGDKVAVTVEKSNQKTAPTSDPIVAFSVDA